MTLINSKTLQIATLPLLVSVMLGFLAGSVRAAEGGEVFGPAKPVVIKTPFSPAAKGDDDHLGADSLVPIEISPNAPTGRRSLIERMTLSRLYLPERMVLGRVAEFTVKAKPGKWVAIAMADKDTGSKPVLGHPLRLGPDRKVVGTIKVPESGLATISVECPVEGDLVGSFLYFEAAVWSDDNMNDMEIAQCVSTESKGPGFNGVLIEPQFEAKKGVKIIPTSVGPFTKSGQTSDLTSPQI
jgi:hypothetical protein